MKGTYKHEAHTIRVSVLSSHREDDVLIDMLIYPFSSLKKLNITYIPPNLWVHQKAHCFPNSFAVVNIIIIIQGENECMEHF